MHRLQIFRNFAANIWSMSFALSDGILYSVYINMSIEHIYLSLLRQAIWADKVKTDEPTPSVRDNDNAGTIDSQKAQNSCKPMLIVPDEPQLKQLMRLCSIQGTAPLVYDVLLGSEYHIPDDLRLPMKQVCLSNMMQFARLKDEMAYTFDTLKNNGIHPYLLKGFGLATLYPKPYLRSWGDLDVYVGSKQYHQAAAVLRQTFPKAKHHDEEWEELKHYNFVLPNGSLIEMHHHTMAFFSRRDGKYFYRLEEEAMNSKTADIEGYTVNIPDDKFNMLFVFMHAWEHFYESGAGMKQIADVALLAHSLYRSNDCDNEELAAYLKVHLKRMKMLQPWRIMGYLIVKALQLPSEEWPLYSDSATTRKYGERLYKRVMKEGLCRPKDFGDSKDRYEARDKAMALPIYKRKWLTLKSKICDASPMWHYAPRYTLHRLATSIGKGIRRTIHREEMVLY